MRIRILAVADDLPQADRVLRSLERSGFTTDEVTVLLACADERVAPGRPGVGAHLPAPFPSSPAPAAGPGPAAISVTGPPAFGGVAVVDGAGNRLGPRPLTFTVNERVAANPLAGIVRDLQQLGIPIAQAVKIATTVRVHNIIILVEERPGGDGDAIIDSMLDEGLPTILMMAEAEDQDAAPRCSGGACGKGARGGWKAQAGPA